MHRNPDYRKDLLKSQHELKETQEKIKNILQSRDYENIFNDLKFLKNLHPNVFRFTVAVDGSDKNKENEATLLEQIENQKGNTFEEKIEHFLMSIKMFRAVQYGLPKDILFLKSMENVKGEYFNAKTKNGYNLLMIAAGRGHASIVDALIYKYPDLLKDKNNNGDNPLMIAAKKGRTSILDALVYKYPHLLKDKNKKRETALMIAERYQQKDCVTILTKAEKEMAEQEMAAKSTLSKKT
jgi:ankyrin repeat protein